eukprot:CAMPEP_0170346786 /NCGR_PEP_ID=MMETSP0116_2-20130129/74643_1 /TAXON_ID=400756 /ORGANISM="Durinskia baltica, Strain CSIRO CS-38" /LENGTH=505 /DNA_ID=CAMNT_0010600589 /DNA_START=88 /DNA_END=1602 /DNA_ORIENTATION=+
MVGYTSSQLGQHIEPYVVKNTFIEVDSTFLEDDFFDGGVGHFTKRQVSEPAFVSGRQTSSHYPATQLDVLRETLSELPAMEPSVPQDTSPMSAAAEIEVRHEGAWSTSTPTPASPLHSSSSDFEEPEVETESAAPPAEATRVSNGLESSKPLNAKAMPWAPTRMPAHMGQEEVPTGRGSFVDVVGPEAPKAAAAPVVARTQATPEVPREWSDVITVMMRNLPNRYTQQMLLEEIVSAGFDGEFDFLYLPIDPETRANKGYAFINFVDPQATWRFKSVFEGRQMSRFNSGKYVSLSAAALQGLEANYAHYSTARCSRGDPTTRPLFLREPCGIRGRNNANRRGGQRRRANGRSLVDAAVERQSEGRTQRPQQLPQRKNSSCSESQPGPNALEQVQQSLQWVPADGMAGDVLGAGVPGDDPAGGEVLPLLRRFRSGKPPLLPVLRRGAVAEPSLIAKDELCGRTLVSFTSSRGQTASDTAAESNPIVRRAPGDAADWAVDFSRRRAQ